MASSPHTPPTARLAGIDIKVHWSWPIIAGLVALGITAQLRNAHPEVAVAPTLILAVGGTAIFFGSVLVHELAHALTARRRGIEVRRITMYLLGGATETTSGRITPGDELVVAVVGPLTSIGVATALGAAAVLAGPSGDPLPDLLGSLAVLNLILAAFNIIPGLPFDGGRVLRAIVWAVTGNAEKATRWATSAGVAVGYGLIGLGLLVSLREAVGALWLVGIGWIVSQSARHAERQERVRSSVGGLTAADVMSTPVVAIPAEATVGSAVRDYFARRNETVFPVVDNGRLIGLLPSSTVREVPAVDVWRTTVEQVAVHHQPALIANPSTPMREVINALADGSRSKARVLVVDRDRVVGIISPTDVIRHRMLSELVGST